MYNGVFNPTKSILKDYFDGWSVLEGLCDIILHYRPNCVVEIGAGESTPILARAAERAQVKFYSVDQARHKLKTYTSWQECLLAKSKDFMKQFKETPAIVLIDGNHTYTIAKMEFEFFFKVLVPGGVIFLHDTMPPHETYLDDNACGDVYKLRQELEKRDDMDCFTWPYSAKWMGLTMIIKKELDRAEWEK